MGRAYFLNGPTMVYVKGRTDSGIANLTELGLSEGPIRVSLDFRHEPINVDAWGSQIPPELQAMLAGCSVQMNLINIDRSVLDVCIQLSMAGAPAIGALPSAGQLMGNNQDRFAPSLVSPATGQLAGNNYIGLNLSSPVAGKPWRFFYSYLTNPDTNLGTEKSLWNLNWAVIPYNVNLYNGGLGSYGQLLWDYIGDN